MLALEGAITTLAADGQQAVRILGPGLKWVERLKLSVPVPLLCLCFNGTTGGGRDARAPRGDSRESHGERTVFPGGKKCEEAFVVEAFREAADRPCRFGVVFPYLVRQGQNPVEVGTHDSLPE